MSRDNLIVPILEEEGEGVAYMESPDVAADEFGDESFS